MNTQFEVPRSLLNLAFLVTLLLAGCSGVRESTPDAEKVEACVETAKEKASQNDFRGAIFELTEAIDIEKDDPSLYLMRGYAKFQIEDWVGAVSDYSQYLQAHPDSADVHSKKGQALAMNDDLDGALQEFSRAIQLSPEEAGYYQNRANLLGMKKQFGAAIEDCDRALKLRPSYEIYCNRGVFKQENGDLASAITDFTAAIELNPTDGDAYLERAQCYSRLGRNKEAEADKLVAKRLLKK